jgi:hypothetical protein
VNFITNLSSDIIIVIWIMLRIKQLWSIENECLDESNWDFELGQDFNLSARIKISAQDLRLEILSC